MVRLPEHLQADLAGVYYRRCARVAIHVRLVEPASWFVPAAASSTLSAAAMQASLTASVSATPANSEAASLPGRRSGSTVGGPSGACGAAENNVFGPGFVVAAWARGIAAGPVRLAERSGRRALVVDSVHDSVQRRALDEALYRQAVAPVVDAFLRGRDAFAIFLGTPRGDPLSAVTTGKRNTTV